MAAGVRRRVALGLLAPATMLAVTTVAVAAASSAGSASWRGPDVSSHQHAHHHPINWQKVRRSGARFAFVKATEGSSYTNPYFAHDYAAAARAGLIRAAYHFARPHRSLASARDQADYFVRVAGTADQRGDLPPVLDLEVTGGLSPAHLQEWTEAFLQRVQRLTGRAPMIYTYPTFWERCMGDTTSFRGFPLWIADYRSGGPHIPLPGDWTTWTFWQYTSSAKVSGIRGRVDMSEFSGDPAALRRLATPPGSGAPAPDPSPTPSPTPGLIPPLILPGH